MALLTGDALALLVLNTAAGNPCLVPACEKFARQLFGVGIDGEAVVVGLKQDSPFGTHTVALLDIVCLVRNNIGIHEFGGIID